MKKKILSIVTLASLMMLGGCGNKTSDVPSDTTKPTESTNVDSTTKPSDTNSTTNPSPDTSIPVETAETRHQKYMTNQTDANADITIKGKVIHSVSYSGSTTCNIAVQEGIYGYWINNVPKANVTIGKSYEFTGKGANKSYPAINLKSGTATEIADVETTTLTLGAASNNFENSRNAYISIPEGGVVISSADAKNHKYGFMIGEKEFFVTFNASVTEAEAITNKVSTLGVGCKVTKLAGEWHAEDTLQICDPNEIEFTIPAASSVTVKAADDATSLQATTTLQLTATVNPEAASQEVVWSSEKTEIATVSETGLVTGLKEGTTKIFATAKGTEVKGEISLTVTAAPSAPVSSITVTAEGDAKGADIDETLQLTAAILPDNASRNVTWTSNNDEIATVDNTGLVTFVGDGDVTIKATATDGSNAFGEINLSTQVKNLKTAAEIVELVTPLNNNVDTDELSYRGKVTAIKDATNFIISDGTGIVQTYNYSSEIPEGLKVGDTLLFKGKAKKYNTLVEITSGNLIISHRIVTGVPTEATTMTKAEIVALSKTKAFSKGQFVKLENVKAYTSGSNKKLNIEGENITAINVTTVKDFTLPVDTWGSVTGHIVNANNNVALWVDSFTANATTAPASITISGSTNVFTGKSTTLTAIVNTEGEYTNCDTSVTWTVANKDASITDALATIDNNGVLTANDTAGVVIVTATSVANSEVKATYEVTIESSANAKEYKLVKSVNDIAIDDTITFAYVTDTTSYGMGAQNGTYRTKVDLTITNDAIAETEGLFEFKVVAGYQDNTYAFFDGTNYLAYNGSSNQLNTATAVDQKSSFTVTIDENGIAKIESCNTAKRLIQYNASSPRFACYTDSQQNPSIFKLSTKA